MLMRVLYVLLIGAWPGLAASAAEEIPPPSLDPVSFERDIHPMLAAKCFVCHAGDQAKGEFQLDSREALLEGGFSGPAVVVGGSSKSYLIELVSGLHEGLLMPPKGQPLTREEIGKLRRWIDDGLDWTFTEGGGAVATPLELLDTEPPLDAPHPIDAFITAYFDEHEIAEPPLAGSRFFLRRAYLDIIGLLPTPGEAALFRMDQRPGARERLIEQLLEDDAGYAEHWMTFWNDALRNDFVGTGYIDGGREQFTGWLFEALYTNMPYDQFAEALVNPGEEGPRGFTKGIVWRGVTNANEQPPMQAARSIAQVFLGVNLKCASCHDSFVDHWTLKDAYGMAAVYHPEPLELVRCEVPTGETAEAKFLWPDVGSIDGSAPLGERKARLASLVTSPGNGYFARQIVNRVWAELFGRGFIEPLANIEGEAWHPALLDWLARDFIENGYDLKHLLHRIMTSKAYQYRAAAPAADDDETYVFRGPYVRRMHAEQFLDALASITGVWHREPKFMSAELRRRPVRAWRAAADDLMRALGRPNREQIVLRREEAATTLQALELTNGDSFTNRLMEGAALLAAESGAVDDGFVEALYHRAYLRAPAPDELETAQRVLGSEPGQESVADLLWAMTLSPEFQLIY